MSQLGEVEAGQTIVSEYLRDHQLLVIEDAPDVQRLLCYWLTKSGAEVTLADNGQVGIDRVQDKLSQGQTFDLILTDLQMPVVDGWQAIHEIRAVGFDRPIIVVSAEVDTLRWQEVTGADAFLSKPFNREQLLAVIRSHACPVTESQDPVSTVGVI